MKGGIGAIIGDIVGSPYEFTHNNIKTEKFPLFSELSHFTDDTVMTIAVAEALAKTRRQPEAAIKKALVASMTAYGRAYPHAGYGARFTNWINDPVPYGSWGNGSAMRVSGAGWLFDTLEETLEKAAWSAEVSHNHPEGIKGAQAVAAAIFLTRKGMDKASLRDYLQKTFNYDLSRSLLQIRPGYVHVESCQETVPEALTAFFESASFEDTLRKAVSLGGDCDTLTAIAASVAEAAYPVPDEIRNEALSRLDARLLNAVKSYEAQIAS